MDRGLLALLWYAYGCYEYLMTQTGNEAFLAAQPAGWVDYWESLPAWLGAFWALAVWVFAVALVGTVIDLGYQLFLTDMPASLSQGMLGIIDWVIVILVVFLLFYSWSMDRRGVLR